MDYPCAKFDFSFSRFGFIVRTNRHKQTHIITDAAHRLKPRSHRARQRASTRPIKLMIKIGSIHTDRVDARPLICIHRMSDVSLSYTYRLVDF